MLHNNKIRIIFHIIVILLKKLNFYFKIEYLNELDFYLIYYCCHIHICICTLKINFKYFE